MAGGGDRSASTAGCCATRRRSRAGARTRRSRSATRDGDPALVEDFYARRGARALVQVSPAEAWTSLDAELARRGWSSEGPTDVLVADARRSSARTDAGRGRARGASRRGLGGGLGGVRGAPRRRRARPRGARAHRAGDRLCPAAEDLGVGLAVCERGWAGLFCVATAASARRRGIARTRGARADALGRRARRAADLPTGRDRQRAGARALRGRGLPALARLSLPRGPAAV